MASELRALVVGTRVQTREGRVTYESRVGQEPHPSALLVARLLIPRLRLMGPAGLMKLYEKYKTHGLEILGFPCNQVGRLQGGGMPLAGKALHGGAAGAPETVRPQPDGRLGPGHHECGRCSVRS